LPRRKEKYVHYWHRIHQSQHQQSLDNTDTGTDRKVGEGALTPAFIPPTTYLVMS
jgi:hypothetical protein